ncbi:hypothetical protein A2715_00085 [Candidatus Woesebacteria bacterium RIFCSPHIGHO2_01_FULL_39_32]|uniref:Nucleoside 2-deoxyribosyltransferase n=1 Tax=Candidatus Woesebacteria bacterium RIFCSPLOWO2_01_FULL_39_25 TaxID=1802521 RepID=A0A1F8BNH2_9BACT|nr:MAG: hypothetical protein UT00_C0016G0004 [Parcubacteria group bacterium GW2011_GWA1_38_7]OGM05635.1 MAG: hypothetical protein A2124_01190 [Candidatus Woesebacteria bacterium GWB1_37_5]OGM24964.1 MAG: hypothetical protein A2715_00085 [Candidatus Woesebacteria bacterium RIFCSPHIGHO2_01_FULL_39_32]OGM35477.1 MAG: hypothetical protein A3F01_02335 [Candidatus Woesebacteria bacterium RIFCSPHIGHO2_12_FULL_38_11]OGM65592.1 MAG: hypothetical protein A2893_01545 [Candidatus Woesebacteria bacterium RI
MRVLFEFSREDLEKRFTYLNLIKSHIFSLNYKLTRDLLTEIKEKGDRLPSDIFNIIQDAISEADAVIIEGSRISMGVGFILSESINKGKPVLFLSDSISNNLKSRFVKKIKSKYLITSTYESKKDLIEALDNFFEETGKIKTRFNLVLDNKLDSFVTIESDKKGISKTEYITNLINKEVKKEKSRD